METFTVCKHESGMYWYIWNNTDNTQVCTADGEPMRFATKEQAEQYITE